MWAGQEASVSPTRDADGYHHVHAKNRCDGCHAGPGSGPHVGRRGRLEEIKPLATV